jgi:hypothetical protein
VQNDGLVVSGIYDRSIHILPLTFPLLEVMNNEENLQRMFPKQNEKQVPIFISFNFEIITDTHADFTPFSPSSNIL